MLRPRPLIAVFAVLISLATAGCTDNPTSPSVSAPFNQTDLRAGIGTEAAVGGLLTVNYTGWLYDLTKTDQKGLIFDTSLGKTPFTFTLGAGQVIRGWEVGVPGMRVGGVRRLVIPPSMAYGDQRAGAIPPNTTLVFEIELLSAVY
jgi:FKBP-type peptidyl-prolyl cis-trans isomerase FkpA